MTSTKTILLIEPPFYRLFKPTFSLTRLPLSLGYIGAVVKEYTHWSVFIYNADFSTDDEPTDSLYLFNEGHRHYKRMLESEDAEIWSEIHKTIMEIQPDAVGITVKSQSLLSARHVARIVKTINSRIPVIVGGPHPTLVPECLNDIQEFDICVLGEGEETIIELLEQLDRNRDLSSVKGIAFRKNKRVYTTPKRPLIKNLDELPFPFKAAENILLRYSSYPANAFRYIFATRGCPFSCSFCGSYRVWGRNVRFRSPKNVLDEIRQIKLRKNIDYFHFDDDTFGITRNYLRSLTNCLMSEKSIKWSCEMHPGLVDWETIKLMKKAGCLRISLGLESLENETLKKINKNTTVQQVLNVCNIIRKEKIAVHVFLMIGFPWETPGYLKYVLNKIDELHVNQITCSIVTPYPGTKLYEYCQNIGLIESPMDWSRFHHQSPENHFLENIKHDTFQEIANAVFKKINRKNAMERLKTLFSRETVLLLKNREKNQIIKKCRSLLFEVFQSRSSKIHVSLIDKSE